MQTDKCFHLVYFIERDSLLSWFGPIKEMFVFLYLRMISWKQVRTKPLYICKYPPLPYDKKSIFMKYPSTWSAALKSLTTRSNC